MSENSLIPVENINALKVFTEDGLDPLLEKISNEVADFKPDLDTVTSRKEIASMAHKVAQSKTFIDKAGKTLVDEWKSKAKVVDTARKKSRDFLDDLKAKVRQPLTDWEAEEARKVKEAEEKAEAEKQAEIARIAKEKQDKIDAENKRIADEQAKKEKDLADAKRKMEEAETKRKAKAKKEEAALLKKQKKQEEALEDQKRKLAEEQAVKQAELDRQAEELARKELELKIREEERDKAAKAQELAVQAEAKKLKEEADAKAEAERKAKAEVEEAERAVKEKEEARIADDMHRKEIETVIYDTIKEEVESSEVANIVLVMLKDGKIPHVSIQY